ncbi:hypothetical protein ABZ759_05430 [Streptomyces sp. NPDC047860]|uniref:hypothetical protein n=1 Tax=Streptomyces sp. NPDC047860 TaxID=3155743 RepID=UPI00340904DA
MKKNVRTLLTGGVVCLLVFGTIASYRYFTGGLDRLPDKVCSGAVDREIVTKALPSARDAQEGSRVKPPGGRFLFTCHVYTSGDSIMSGEAETTDVAHDTWASYYEGQADGNPVRTRKGPVHVLSVSENRASLYVPCTRAGKNPDATADSHGLIAESRTIGKTRATGEELRQAITDFAYFIMQRAFKLNKCREVEALPKDLSDAYSAAGTGG